jgi:ParB family chromosome partitioning protein
MTQKRPLKRSGLVSKPSPTFVPENVSGRDMSAASAKLPRLDFSTPDGASALAPVAAAAIEATQALPGTGREVVRIRVDLLVDSPYQPRFHYNEAKLAELADSLRLRQIDPLSVRPLPDGRFEIIGGHRRKRAAPMAQLDELDCIVIEVSDEEAQILVLAANEAHEEFKDYERALAYQAALDAGKRGTGGVRTQKQLAEKIGRAEPTVSRILAMLKLPQHVQKVLHERPEAFSSNYVAKMLKLTSEAHDEAKLVHELYRVADGELQISALFSVMASANAAQSAAPATRQGLSLQRGNQLFAQVTPNVAKRQVTVKLPGDCDVDEVANLILTAIDQRFAAKKTEASHG